jgi:hypothetical protein
MRESCSDCTVIVRIFDVLAHFIRVWCWQQYFACFFDSDFGFIMGKKTRVTPDSDNEKEKAAESGDSAGSGSEDDDGEEDAFIVEKVRGARAR